MNPYMGPFSLAKIPVRGRIDEDWEILLNCHALAYDTNNPFMLGNNGVEPINFNEIKSRFTELKRIARKYAPGKLRTIEQIERMCMDHHHGRISDRNFIHRLRLISLSHGVYPGLIDQAEARINAVEGFENRGFPSPVPPKSNMNSIFKEAGKRFDAAYKNSSSWFKLPKENHRPKNPMQAMFGKQKTNRKNPMQAMFGKQKTNRKNPMQAMFGSMNRPSHNPAKDMFKPPGRPRQMPIQPAMSPKKILKKMFGGI